MSPLFLVSGFLLLLALIYGASAAVTWFSDPVDRVAAVVFVIAGATAALALVAIVLGGAA